MHYKRWQLYRDTDHKDIGNYRHGMTGTPEYRTWKGMHNRCRNPNSQYWHLYGGRGIKVCDRWKHFINFYNDMGNKPEGMSIDRIDPNGDYEPNNCRWADNKTQSRNSRVRKDNKTGYKGISFDKTHEKYVATIGNKRIGYFKNIDDAIKARKEAERDW